jgi:hypothetical protein
LAGQQNFNTSAKEITRGRIFRAERLRLKTSATAIKAGGKYASVVEDDEICWPQQVGEFAELAILKDGGLGREMQKARRSAVRKRLLGD